MLYVMYVSINCEYNPQIVDWVLGNLLISYSCYLDEILTLLLQNIARESFVLAHKAITVFLCVLYANK